MKEHIIFLNGMWAGAWCWEKFQDYFESKGFSCIIPNLRHHEQNADIEPDLALGTVSLSDYVEDLEKIIRDFKTPPILIGHSMGGLLGQILASKNLVKLLILINPAPPRDISALKPTVIKSFIGHLKVWKFWRKPLKQSFKNAVYSTFHLLDKEEQIILHRKLGYESGRVIKEIGLPFFDRDKKSAVDEIKINCPVLILGSGKDRLTPVSVVRKIYTKYKSVATYKEYPDNAHWIIGEPGWIKAVEDIFTWVTEHLKNTGEKTVSY